MKNIDINQDKFVTYSLKAFQINNIYKLLDSIIKIRLRHCQNYHDLKFILYNLFFIIFN